MEERVLTSHANRRTKALKDQKLGAVVSTVALPLADPHALTVGGGFSSSSGSMEAPVPSGINNGSVKTPGRNSSSSDSRAAAVAVAAAATV